jgi:hypothetical protein
MDLDSPIKLEDVRDNMDQFIKKRRNESEIEYRLRIWKSKDMWEYVKLEWKEQDIDDEEYMIEKMLEMKRQVHRMDEDDIDREIKGTIVSMKNIDRSTKEHEYIWCEMYIEYLKERKDELHIEVGMKRCRM